MAPKKPSPKSLSYRFGKAKRFTLAQLKKLAPLKQQQVIQTVERLRGVSCATLDDCARELREGVGSDTMELRPIQPIGARDATHEMWIYGDEHGLVFPIGEDEATPVHCVQQHFWSTDDSDPQAVALAEALDEMDW